MLTGDVNGCAGVSLAADLQFVEGEVRLRLTPVVSLLLLCRYRPSL